MTDSEQNLLVALVLMANQYLDEYDDEVDSRSTSAGERAIEILANHGLMEIVNTRFGRWTEAGKQFRRDVAGIRERAQVDYPGRIVLVAETEPKG
jgi:hypothetical protein